MLSQSSKVEIAVDELMPLVKEIKSLQKKEEQYKKKIDRVTVLAKNPDLIGLMKNLSSLLPTSSYLDQMRMDKKDETIQIQGYTDDIGELTSKLKGLGESKLKSTSRRRDKTYFQLEINLK